MRDYKKHIHVNYVRQKPAPKRIQGKSSPRSTYQLKFYLLIAFMLGSCYLYIQYQIQNDTKSVFADIYRIYKKHFIKKESVKTEKAETVESETVNEIVKPSVSENEKPQIEGKEEKFYLFGLEKGNFTTRFVNGAFEADKNVYYYKLVNEMMNYRPENKKLINTFSSQMKLLSSTVEKDVLLLSFNKNFEYSKYGHLGLELQIQQVLWTVFNSKKFQESDLNSISFLIEGKRKQTLGGEGKEIKLFYSKKDLKKVISGKSHA